MISWDSFEFFVTYMNCPLRIEVYREKEGESDHFKILIPPDDTKPRATRWRTLFAGELKEELDDFFRENLAKMCDVRIVTAKERRSVVCRGGRGKK